MTPAEAIAFLDVRIFRGDVSNMRITLNSPTGLFPLLVTFVDRKGKVVQYESDDLGNVLCHIARDLGADMSGAVS